MIIVESEEPSEEEPEVCESGKIFMNLLEKWRENIFILNSIGSSEYESAISETIECETGMNDFKNEQNLGPLILNK